MCAHPGSRPAERWTVEKGPSWDGGGHLWSKTDEQGQTSDICIIIPKTPGPLTRQPRPLLRAHPQAGGRGTPEGGQHSGRCCCWREGAPLRTHTGSRGAQVGGGRRDLPGRREGACWQAWSCTPSHGSCAIQNPRPWRALASFLSVPPDGSSPRSHHP